MSAICAVLNCNSDKFKDNISFHRLPSIYNSHGDIDPRRQRRRDAWIAALHMQHLPETNLEFVSVCSKHFIKGQPGELGYENDPDWIPSQYIHSYLNSETCGGKKRRKMDEDYRIPFETINTQASPEANPIVKEEVFDEIKVEENTVSVIPFLKDEPYDEDSSDDNKEDIIDIKEEVLSCEGIPIDSEFDEPLTHIESEMDSDVVRLEPGFVKAYAAILPVVTMDMIHDFYLKIYIPTHTKLENNSTSSESYGDEAIQFVQILRENNGITTLKCKIKASEDADVKFYNVRIIFNEEKQIIDLCECVNCAIAKVGCKHAVTVLYWLHRKCDRPHDEEESYWITQKEQLPLFITTKDFGPPSPTVYEVDSKGFLSSFIQNAPANCKAPILKYYRTEKSADLHKLMCKFQSENSSHDINGFINFYMKSVTSCMCDDIYKRTLGGSEHEFTLELLYGRITPSTIYEASRMEASDFLNDTILQQYSFMDELTKSQKQFKNNVIEHVAKLKNITIVPAGLQIKTENPIFAAITDGLSEEYCILVKCALKKSHVKKYIVDDKIKEKCYCELMLQLHLYNKQKGLLCVAAPNFRKTQIVHVIEVMYDEKYFIDLLVNSTTYWREHIYPIIFRICQL